MSAAIISDNTTIKNTPLPYGTIVIANNASTPLFTVPANTVYEINVISYESQLSGGGTYVPYIKKPGGVVIPICTDVKAAAALVHPQISRFPDNANCQNLFFNPPLVLSEGYEFGFTVAGSGSTEEFGYIGKATINTP